VRTRLARSGLRAWLQIRKITQCQGVSFFLFVSFSMTFDCASRCLDAHTASAQAPGMSTRNGTSVSMMFQDESDKVREPLLRTGASERP
jgi:hypothetical protein